MAAHSTPAGVGLAVLRPAPPRVKPAPKPVPVRSVDFAHVGLAELRTYRAALQAEEGKVSYWRRILQARLDLVRVGTERGAGGALDQARLRPLLTDERVAAGRTALTEVLPVDDIPPLPDLAELWEREVDASDLDGQCSLERDLATAEAQLSAYRAALHRRLGGATGELIARYRELPALCLSALPVPPPRAPQRPPGA